ncbi:hypothetical protein CC80DRAFT_538741, partial [Byssothecium circinans]
YKASIDGRHLLDSEAFEEDIPNLTHESCLELCREWSSRGGNNGKEWRYIGIEEGKDCRCSQSLAYTADDEPGECTSTTTGDENQLGGGVGYVSVWENAFWREEETPEESDSDSEESDSEEETPKPPHRPRPKRPWRPNRPPTSPGQAVDGYPAPWWDGLRWRYPSKGSA